MSGGQIQVLLGGNLREMTRKIIIPLLFVTIVIAIAIHNIDPAVLHKKGVCYEKYKIQELSLFSQVLDKHIDSLNHNSQKIVLLDLNTQKEIYFHIDFDSSCFYESVAIGDTLFKEIDSLIIGMTPPIILYQSEVENSGFLSVPNVLHSELNYLMNYGV